MSLPYTALHTFHLVVRFGTLKQTAEHLKLTESAVSHQIKRLEDKLGYALFYKSGRQLKTTPEGTLLAKALEQPFDHIDQVLLNKQPQSHNTITLYCLPSLLEPWLLPKLLNFKEAHPDLELAIRYHSSAPDYLDEHSLRIGSHEANITYYYRVTRLFSGETVPVCSPIYLSQHPALTSKDGLLSANLLHDHSPHSWTQWFAQRGQQIEQPASLIYEDFHLLKMATLAAQGVALCPEVLIQQDIQLGTLVTLSEQKGNLGRYYGIEHNRYAHNNVCQLVEHLIKM